MTAEVPIRQILVNEKNFVYTGIIWTTSINTMPQKANQMCVAKPCNQIQPQLKISDCILLWQRQTPYSYLGSILQSSLVKLQNEVEIEKWLWSGNKCWSRWVNLPSPSSSIRRKKKKGSTKKAAKGVQFL